MLWLFEYPVWSVKYGPKAYAFFADKNVQKIFDTLFAYISGCLRDKMYSVTPNKYPSGCKFLVKVFENRKRTTADKKFYTAYSFFKTTSVR